MSLLRLQDFGGGIWQELQAPPGHVYDAINAIVVDAGLMRRGGTVLKSTSDTAGQVVGLFDGTVLGGERTLLWTDAGNLYVLAANDRTPVLLATLMPAARPAVHHGVAYFPAVVGTEWWMVAYAGSRKSASYSAGTISVAAGGTAVTGTGTAFLANVDAGMFLSSGGRSLGPVAKVLTDTSLTLALPAIPTLSGAAYSATPTGTVDNNWTIGQSGISLAAAGDRLLVGFNDRVYESRGYRPLENLLNFPTTEFQGLPEGAVVLGVIGSGGSAFVFSTAGVWEITNVAYDLTDDAGNPQQGLAQVSKDVVLWSDDGLAAWASQVVVPALDDVYLFSPGAAPTVISRGIRSLYRSYVQSGFAPGKATIFEGHYILPIMDGPGPRGGSGAAARIVADVLVCRLDQGNAAWTRWHDQARCTSFATRVPSDGTAPRLLAGSALRLLDATSCLQPQAAYKVDSDGTAFPFDVTTNDLDTGPGNRNTVQKVRARYELVDAAADNPTVAVSYLVGPATATDVAVGTFPESDGVDPVVLRLVKRARHIRVRLLSSGAAATLRLRTLELFVRDSNRP